MLGLAVGAAPLDDQCCREVLGDVLDQGGHPQATAVGVPDRLPAALAAFVNGVLAHSLDYDDTHLPSVLHPSASVVPAALAAAEHAGADGASTSCAPSRSGSRSPYASAWRATTRDAQLGLLRARPARHLDLRRDGRRGRGLAAARRRRTRGVVDALGVAASMASGVIEANRTGGTVKRLHCGWAAHAGVAAAELVRARRHRPADGPRGPVRLLRGLAARADGTPTRSSRRARGRRGRCPGIFFKPYPANHFTHAAIDAAARLRERASAPTTSSVWSLGVPAPVTCARSASRSRSSVRRRPATRPSSAGRTPSPLGLFGGCGLGARLDDYTDALAPDPARRALMAKVDVVADERCDEIFPHQFPAVRHRAPARRRGPSSRRCSPTAVVPSGRCRSTSSPPSSTTTSQAVLPRADADALAAACRDLPALETLAPLTRLSPRSLGTASDPTARPRRKVQPDARARTST